MCNFRKLRANEIEVRVGNVIDTKDFQGCSLLLYKDARVDMNILDEAVGCMNWKRSHTRDNANCIVSIWDKEKGEWVSKEDTGTESNTEAEKGLASDSFKRASVNWGIGRELYTAPKIIVPVDLVVDKNGRKKAPSNVSWEVDEIGYNENGEINVLKINQKKGSESKVVFELGKFIKKQPQKPKMDYESACQVKIKLSNGDVEIERLNNDQIKRALTNENFKQYHEALQVVLDFRNTLPFRVDGNVDERED